MEENTKKIVLISLIVFFGLVAVGGMAWFVIQNAKYQQYVSKKDKLSIKYPKAWAAFDHPSPDVVAIFQSPQEGALDLIRENVNITITDFNDMPMTFQTYIDESLSQITDTFKNVKTEESAPVRIATFQGHKFVFDVQAEQHLKVVLYAFMYRGYAYNIMYMGEAKHYLKDKITIDDMVASFKMSF